MFNHDAGNNNTLYHNNNNNNNNNTKNLPKLTLRDTQYIHTATPSPQTYLRFSLRETLRRSNFTYVGIALNSIQFFYPRAGKITKACFEMYNKKIKTSVSAEGNTI